MGNGVVVRWPSLLLLLLLLMDGYCDTMSTTSSIRTRTPTTTNTNNTPTTTTTNANNTTTTTTTNATTTDTTTTTITTTAQNDTTTPKQNLNVYHRPLQVNIKSANGTILKNLTLKCYMRYEVEMRCDDCFKSDEDINKITSEGHMRFNVGPLINSTLRLLMKQKNEKPTLTPETPPDETNITKLSCENDLNVTVTDDYLELDWMEHTANTSHERAWINDTNEGVDVCLYNDDNVEPIQLLNRYKVEVLYDGYGEDCTTNTDLQQLSPAPEKISSMIIIAPSFKDRSSETRTAHIFWQAPRKQNSRLTQYTLTYHSDNPHHDNQTTIIKPAYKCTPLCTYDMAMKPESSYSFSIYSENEEVPGKLSPAFTKNIITVAGVPFFTVSKPLQVKEHNVTHNSAIIILDGTSISNYNGKVRSYKVLMWNGCGQEKDKDSSKIVYCSRSVPLNAQFPIHIKGRKPKKSDCYTDEYSLDPGTCYTISVKIYTKSHNKQSNFIEINTEYPTKGLNDASIIFGLFFFCLLVTAILYLYYSHTFKPKRYDSIELPIVIHSSPDVNVERRILVCDLTRTVIHLFSNGKRDLLTEFRDIDSVYTPKPCTNAKLPMNKGKSRYGNILPYDDTRVVLKEYPGFPESNFINASYIHGYTKPREFIACQGPLNTTIADFWRMVWEKNVHVIVMLTQCVERSKVKCYNYWPEDSKTFNFAIIGLQVKHIKDENYLHDGYKKRTIQISKNNKVRVVQHFHFLSWPDMGSPSTPDILLKFVSTVKHSIPTLCSHVVIHCSAGVGRTGTFIGLSNLMEEMNDQNSIDVFHTVYRMRLHRTNMVQTLEQYSFLYMCVLKYYLDQKGESQNWTYIERILKNEDVIPDIISGTLSEQQQRQRTDICNDNASSNSTLEEEI